MRRSRIKEYYLKPKQIVKNNEGGTTVEYGSPIKFSGEMWPAGGKIQAEQYGQRLSYIRNLKIDGKYEIKTDEKGIVHYIFSNGLDVVEAHGLCLYVPTDAEPDYKILSIKPYHPLRLEAEKL